MYLIIHKLNKAYLYSKNIKTNLDTNIKIHIILIIINKIIKIKICRKEFPLEYTSNPHYLMFKKYLIKIKY
jgi:hypothetical protein